MAELNGKEVDFAKYCKICKSKDVPETDDPCNECLAEPMNQGSHKPTRWEEKLANERS